MSAPPHTQPGVESDDAVRAHEPERRPVPEDDARVCGSRAVSHSNQGLQAASVGLAVAAFHLEVDAPVARADAQARQHVDGEAQPLHAP